jgi:hypothetical protein
VAAANSYALMLFIQVLMHVAIQGREHQGMVRDFVGGEVR